MRRDRMKRLWRALLPLERAQLALAAYAGGEEPDLLTRATLPVPQWNAFYSFLEFGTLVLTRHRPVAAWLQTRIATIDAQLEALRLRSAWAADAGGRDLGLDLAEGLEDPDAVDSWDTRPTYVDLAVLRRTSAAELVEYDVSIEDRRSWLAIAEVIGMIQRSWSTLLALEEVVPVVLGRLENPELVASMLGDRVAACRISLAAAHSRAEMLLGPISLPEEPADADCRLCTLLGPVEVSYPPVVF